MSLYKWSAVAVFAGAVAFGAVACSEKSADKATNATDTALDKAKTGTDTAIDATKKGAAEAIDATQKASEKIPGIAEKAADKTGQIAGTVAAKSKEIASATSEVVTDAWITTKISAKFADESILKGSDIKVETTDHVVTLKGTVTSGAQKSRAAEIARGTDGVKRVV